MDHAITLLSEFRRRLMRVGIVFMALFGLSFHYSNALFHIYLLPLQRLLPISRHFIATQITSGLVTPLTLVINIAFFFTTPFGLWQLWQFIAPSLYKKERINAGYLISASLGLFALGCLFGYFFILPYMFECMIQALPKDVVLLPEISSVASFITEMLIIFGCSFQIPLVSVLLIRLNLLKLEQCQAIRPYVIIAAFTLGMLLTPPDVVAQILLALPLWGLFELGICLSHVSKKSFRQ